MGGLGALAIKPLQTISLVRQLPSLLINVLRRRLCPCNQQCSSDDSQVLTCGDNRSWETARFYGDGRRCMYSAGGMPFCINNNAAGGVTAISLDKRDTAAGCIPGTYSRDIGNSQILVRDNDQYWDPVAVWRLWYLSILSRWNTALRRPQGC